MDNSVKKCPMCAEQIPLEATVCEYCGAQFDVEVRDGRVESRFIEEPLPHNLLKLEGKITRDGAGVALVGEEKKPEPKKPAPAAVARAKAKAKVVKPKSDEGSPKPEAAVAEPVQKAEPVRAPARLIKAGSPEYAEAKRKMDAATERAEYRLNAPQRHYERTHSTTLPTSDDGDIPAFLRRTADNKVPGAVEPTRGPLAREVAKHHMFAYDQGYAGDRSNYSRMNNAEQAAHDRGANDRMNADRPAPASKPAAKKAGAENSTLSALDNLMKGLMEEEGSPASEHFVAKDRDKTVSNILSQFAKEKGLKNADAIFPQIREGISRKVHEKHDTMEAIAKEVPGFATHTYTSKYVKAMSIAGGERLRAELKKAYPGHDDVFDKHLSDKVFGAMFTRKKTKLDGTRK